MSHYVIIKSGFKVKEALITALKNAFPLAEIEVHETPVHLFGYKGDKRPETAHIVVRRRFIHPAANDLGFRFDPASGAYVMIASEWDLGQWCTPEWRQRLLYDYAEAVGRAIMTKFGLQIQSKTHLPNGGMRVLFG